MTSENDHLNMGGYREPPEMSTSSEEPVEPPPPGDDDAYVDRRPREQPGGTEQPPPAGARRRRIPVDTDWEGYSWADEFNQPPAAGGAPPPPTGGASTSSRAPPPPAGGAPPPPAGAEGGTAHGPGVPENIDPATLRVINQMLERQRREMAREFAYREAQLGREMEARVGQVQRQLAGQKQPQGHKDSKMACPTLNSTGVTEVEAFKVRFQAAVKHNKWSHCRARDELFGAMKEEVLVFVEDIPLGTDLPDDQVRPWTELWALYRARLVSEESHKLLQSEVETYQQGEDDTMMQWYGNLLKGYKAAFADELRQIGIECDQYPRFVNHFIDAMCDRDIRSKVRLERPTTGRKALDLAQLHESNRRADANAAERFGKPRRHRIQQLNRGGVGPKAKEDRACFYCGKAGHLKSACRKYKADKGRGKVSPDATPRAGRTPATPGSRGRGRGRGGPKGKSRGAARSAPGARVAAVTAEAGEDGSDSDSEPEQKALEYQGETGNGQGQA